MAGNVASGTNTSFYFIVKNDGTYDFTPMYEHVKKDVENADYCFILIKSLLLVEMI